MYRERCAKELLELVCNRNIAISDGFMISSENNVSTQCDIIMYQRDTMPVIDNRVANFFPVEIVGFLICNDFNFNFEDLDFENIYEDIPNIRFRHNMILSLQDGLWLYEFDADKAPENMKVAFR